MVVIRAGCPHGQPETDRGAIVERIDRKKIEPDDDGKALNDVGEVVERVGELITPGLSGCPKPGRSGAMMWKRYDSSGIKSRNMWPALGKQCSSRSFGTSAAPASR